MYKIIELFFSFFKIGAFSFGGGYAMLPFIEKEIIDNHKWLTDSQFIDLLALSQSSPGPIATNSATFVGYMQAGFLGSLISTLGVIGFSLIVLNLLCPYFQKYKNHPKFESVFFVLRPITLGFILASCISTYPKAITNFKSQIIFLISFFTLYFLKKIHPVWVILSFGALGILFKF